ncbi:hypothetical protein [Streptococcus sp. 20-1249]|uniref:hypothetical protein n=1 Tax=Streptococcus hepaticus TaxID=3349163 RepID=UPI0037479895
MEIILVGRDYARSDECRFYTLDSEGEYLDNDLTYSEVCQIMHKKLEEAVDEGYIDKDSAFDIEDDMFAFNQFMENL